MTKLHGREVDVFCGEVIWRCELETGLSQPFPFRARCVQTGVIRAQFSADIAKRLRDGTAPNMVLLHS